MTYVFWVLIGFFLLLGKSMNKKLKAQNCLMARIWMFCENMKSGLELINQLMNKMSYCWKSNLSYWNTFGYMALELVHGYVFHNTLDWFSDYFPQNKYSFYIWRYPYPNHHRCIMYRPFDKALSFCLLNCSSIV